MATGWDTNAIRIDEEEDDYSPPTAKDVKFICPEGMNAKLKTFREVRKKALFLQLELDGKIYSGVVIEAIDSFAPVNLVSSERRSTTGCKTSKKQQSDVTKYKKTNVYSRENYPKGYVDVHNTIQARLRFGRDRRNSDSRTLSTEGYFSSHSKNNIALTKRIPKMKSFCSGEVENSTSNDDSSFCNYSKKNRNSRRGRKKMDKSVSEATIPHENSTSSYALFKKPSASEFYKDAKVKSDTCFSSPNVKIQCGSRKGESQVAIIPINMQNTAMSPISPDQLGTGPDLITFSPEFYSDLITFSPEINSETLCKNDDDAVHCVSNTRVSSCQLSEPDLITFSPRSNSEILWNSNDEVFQSSPPDRISQNQSLKPKLSASLQTNKREKDLLDRSEAKCAASNKIISHQCLENKIEPSVKKVDGVQLINENNYQFLESRVENAWLGKGMLSVSDYITMENILKALIAQSSLASKFQYNRRNIVEIQSLVGLNTPETATLGDAMFHQFNDSGLEKHNETNVKSFTHSKNSTPRKSNIQQSESKLISQTEDPRDISNESNAERSSDLHCKLISRNTSEKETERSGNGDQALESSECKLALSLHLPASGDDVKQLESSDVVIATPQLGPSCQTSECHLQPSMKK